MPGGEISVSTFLIMFGSVVGVCVVFALYRFLKDRLSPKVETAAVVEGKRKYVQSPAGSAAKGTSNPGVTLYYLTFRTQDGARVELRVSQAMYRKTQEAVSGVLRYQGSRFLEFSQAE